MGVLGAQLFLNDGKIGYVTPSTVWEGLFAGRGPSTNTEGFILLSKCWHPLSPGLPVYPGNRWCRTLTQEGLVAFMSAEILTAFGTQLPAPGAGKWEAKEEVGKSCGSPGKAH